MNANFQRRLSSDELAEVARLSADYLSRLFKIETKFTLWEYVIRLRMEKARELLETSLLSIKEVMVRGITILKSVEGYHKSALADIEKVLPLGKFAPTNVYLDCLNSYAVELSEVGRLQESENVSSLVIASPLTRYYPEWRETLAEVRSRRKRRSIVSISPPLEREYEPAALELDSNDIQK